jgi:hypothetical protein
MEVLAFLRHKVLLEVITLPLVVVAQAAVVLLPQEQMQAQMLTEHPAGQEALHLYLALY